MKGEGYYLYNHFYELQMTFKRMKDAGDYLNLSVERIHQALDKREPIGPDLGYYIKRHKINLIYKDQTVGHCSIKAA